MSHCPADHRFLSFKFGDRSAKETHAVVVLPIKCIATMECIQIEVSNVFGRNNSDSFVYFVEQHRIFPALCEWAGFWIAKALIFEHHNRTGKKSIFPRLPTQTPINPYERTIFIEELQMVGKATRPSVLFQHMLDLHLDALANRLVYASGITMSLEAH